MLNYRLELLQPGHVTLIGSNKTATSTDDITVRDTPPNGREVTYQAAVEHFRRFHTMLPSLKEAMNDLGVAYTKLGVLAMDRDDLGAGVAQRPCGLDELRVAIDAVRAGEQVDQR